MNTQLARVLKISNISKFLLSLFFLLNPPIFKRKGSCFKDKQYFQILIITFFLLNPPIFKRKGSCFKDKQYFQILIITFFLLNPPIFKRKGSGNWRQGKFAIVQVRDETQVLSK